MDLDAPKLVGLLAEEDRLKVFAALVLQPDTADGLVGRLRLDRRVVVSSLERLVGAGLARPRDDGAIAVDAVAFKQAARQAATARTVVAADATEDERLLSRFVADGRIVHIPARQEKKRVLLDWVAGRFEPGQRYAEREVDQLLRALHDDHVALRRLLVDLGFLDRDHGVYWRSGGTL